MQIKELFKYLKPLGLQDKETLVLASLFMQGTRSVTQIAEAAGLKRPHAYNILRALQEKGLVLEQLKNKVRHYAPPKPAELRSYLDRKKDSLARATEEIESFLPSLTELIHKVAKKPYIRFFWGIDGLLSIYEETLTAKEKVIHAYCDFSLVFPEAKDPKLTKWMWNYAQRRADAGILYRGIVNRSPMSDKAFASAKQQRRELKLVDLIDFPLEINIYDHKVAFMSSSHNFMGIVIEDESISHMLRQIHGALWQHLPDYS